MNELDPITTQFETKANKSIVMIHTLSPRVQVHVDMELDTVTVLVDEYIRTQSRASSYSVAQYTTWLHDTYISAIELG